MQIDFDKKTAKKESLATRRRTKAINRMWIIQIKAIAINIWLFIFVLKKHYHFGSFECLNFFTRVTGIKFSPFFDVNSFEVNTGTCVTFTQKVFG